MDNDSYFENTNWGDDDSNGFGYAEPYDNMEIPIEMFISDILESEASNQDSSAVKAWPTFTYKDQNVKDILNPAQLSWGAVPRF